MSNQIVRRTEADTPRSSTEREAFRRMGWDPFRELAPFGPVEEQPARFAPDFEVKETERDVVFKVDVSGIKEKEHSRRPQGRCADVAAVEEAGLQPVRIEGKVAEKSS